MLLLIKLYYYYNGAIDLMVRSADKAQWPGGAVTAA